MRAKWPFMFLNVSVLPDEKVSAQRTGSLCICSLKGWLLGSFLCKISELLKIGNGQQNGQWIFRYRYEESIFISVFIYEEIQSIVWLSMAIAKMSLLFHSSEEFILTYASLKHQLFRCFFVHSEKWKEMWMCKLLRYSNNTELWNNVDKNITTLPNIWKYFLTVTSFLTFSTKDE